MRVQEVFSILAVAYAEDLPANAPNAKGLKLSARKIKRKEPGALDPEIVLKRVELSQAFFNANGQTTRRKKPAHRR